MLNNQPESQISFTYESLQLQIVFVCITNLFTPSDVFLFIFFLIQNNIFEHILLF